MAGDAAALAALPHAADYPDKRSALHHASLGGSVWMVEYLLRRRADPTRADKRGRTPLHLACAYGQNAVVELLVTVDGEAREAARKAAKAAADAAKAAAATAAAAAEATAAAAEAANATGASLPLPPAAAGSLSVSSALVAQPPTLLSQRDAYGRSSLCLAAMRGQEATAALLLELNAPLEFIGNDGATPLLLACSYGHAGTARLLIDASARVDHRDDAGGNALASASANGHTWCVHGYPLRR